MSSDASGEVYVVMKDVTSNGTSGGSPSTGSGSSSGGKTSGAEERWACSLIAVVFAVLGLCFGL